MPPQKKTHKQKAGSRNKSARPTGRRQLKALFVYLILLVIVLGSLLVLSYMRRPSPPAPNVPPPLVAPATPTKPTTPTGQPAALIEEVQGELGSALLESGIPISSVETSRSDELLRLTVSGAMPPQKLLDELSLRFLLIDADLRLEADAAGEELRILRGQTMICLVHFHRPPTPPPLLPTKAGGRVVIIMDDLGRDLETARALLAIDLPVSFAILPGEARATQVAELAHRTGREVLIHIPMEPQSYPATNPGSDALLLGQTSEEIRRRFQEFVERIPYAVGGNNHMGSRFTEYREGMEVVLTAMKEAGLFFVDSRTTGNSVALAEAQRAGVPAVGRDLFLDNVQDVEQISREIRKLVVLAGRQGQAVGICHPYAQTLEALRREAPYLRQQQVELVPVSRLLDR